MLTTSNTLAAFLYLRQGEAMPDPIMDNDSNIIDTMLDNIAVQAWSEGTDAFEVDVDRLDQFITNTNTMLSALETLVLEDGPHGPQYMILFYDAAKETFDHDKKLLRTYFSWLYLVVFGVNEGPRWGDFVTVYGVPEFTALVRRRFTELSPRNGI
jgi:lysyl-tRNA synthetase class I